MRFGDDWAGVFIRGDNAGPWGMYLGMAIDRPEQEGVNVTALLSLRGLQRTLSSCREPCDAQQMVDFDSAEAK